VNLNVLTAAKTLLCLSNIITVWQFSYELLYKLRKLIILVFPYFVSTSTHACLFRRAVHINRLYTTLVGEGEKKKG